MAGATEMDVEKKLDSSLDTLISESKPSRGGTRRGGGRRGRGEGRGERKRDREHQGYGDANPGEPIRVARRIYVGNLSWGTTWQDLKDHFKTAGNVVYADVLRDGTKSKGCGIVEFQTAEEAAEAINSLHLSDLDGREIYVREDREDFELKKEGETRPPREKKTKGRSHDGARGGGGESAGGPGRRVYVGNLSFDTSWQGLKDHFNEFGNVAFADVLTEGGGRSKGCGIVEFTEAQYALDAISSMNNTMLDGRQILVREDREEGSRSTAPRDGGRGGGSRGGPPRTGGKGDGKQVVVQGLPFSLDWQTLKDLMKDAGQVVRADIVSGSDGRSRGYGTVLFESAEDAQAAIETFHGTNYEGRILTVKLDKFY